jgi:hypothetical protein
MSGEDDDVRAVVVLLRTVERLAVWLAEREVRAFEHPEQAVGWALRSCPNELAVYLRLRLDIDQDDQRRAIRAAIAEYRNGRVTA